MPTDPIPTADAASQPPPGAAPLNFEDALARLEAIVHELEEGRAGLAESLARYEEGIGLLRQCFGILETAERRIELLAGVDAAGNPLVEPFDDTATAERAEQSTARGRARSAPEGAGANPPNPAAGAAKPRRAGPARGQNPPPAPASRPPAAPPPDDMDVPRELF